MLKEATIFKVPRAVSQNQNGFLKGCGSYRDYLNYECCPYGDDCIDATYTRPSNNDAAVWIGISITAVGSIAAVIALT